MTTVQSCSACEASSCGGDAWPPCNSREALPVTGRVLHLSGALQVLKDVAEAKVRDLDMWQISMACNVEQQKAEDLPDGKLTQPQQVWTGVWHSSSMQIDTDVRAGLQMG